MTEKVYEALTVCAENQYYTFAVIEPTLDETPKRRKDLLRDLEEVNDLVQLGLLRDISARYTGEIAKCLQERGYGYKVVELTKEGMLMFANAKDRKVN